MNIALPASGLRKAQDSVFSGLVLLGVLINFSGLLSPVLETDGTLYATIAKNMAHSGDWINLKLEGRDWLDKPHLPFWLTALSYKFFGYTSFAYKLPALLCWVLGGWYTYRLARFRYSVYVAQLALLMYLAVEHLLISNVDVRAEPYLTGFCIASLYHFYRLYREKSLAHAVWGAFFAGMAVMTKGIFILIIIGSGIVIDALVRGDWKGLFHPRWWLAVALTCVFFLPELYCLYVQFDLHPEKVVFGQTGVSGLRFFFWDSQFGRFTNSGPIKGAGDPFFYLHTLLWAFLPWSVLFYYALYERFKNRKKADDWVLTGGVLFSLLLFSASKFQLPHYLNVLYPMMCILTAQVVAAAEQKRWMIIAQYGISGLLFLAGLLGIYLISIPFGWAVFLLVGILAVGAIGLFPPVSITNAVRVSLLASLVMNGVYSMLLYPAIVGYQSGNRVADYVNQRGDIPEISVIPGDAANYALEFYAEKPVRYLTFPVADTAYVFLRPEKATALTAEGYDVRVLERFPHYHISELGMSFINKETRHETLDETLLVRLTR
jgi:4-amino-4-deoxy-L-arabinose transferase-like glycosyltransferase